MPSKMNLPPLENILSGADNILDEVVTPKKNILSFNGADEYNPDFDLTIIDDYPEHKFRLWEGERFQSMVDSIKERGIISPLIIWLKNDRKRPIMLAGHNRKLASLAAGKNRGPVIIKKELTEDEADLIVTETNLLQRSFADLRHSERAYCLKQHYDAIKKQGKRTDLLEEISNLLRNANPHEIREIPTCDQVEHKLKKRDKLAEEFGLSATNITRYIRIAELNKFFMKLLDDDILPFMSAYNLAFISQDMQDEISEIMELNPDYKINIDMAVSLRSAFEDGKLTLQRITDILDGKSTSKKAKKSGNRISLKPVVINKYFTKGESKKEIESIIEKALESYFATE